MLRKLNRRLLLIIIGAMTWTMSSHAESAPEMDISKILFEHVLNSNELTLIPGLPAITLPCGITVHLLMVWLSVLLISFLFVRAFRTRTTKPRGIAVVLEALVIFVRDDIVYPVMGEKRGAKWLPFFLTLFVFLLAMNCLGLIPAFKSATGNINVTGAMALMILFLMFFIGIKELGIKLFFANMYPSDTPWAIALFVAFLEIAGTLIKSMVLSLRLFANMFAGHLAILSFLVLIFVIGPLSSLISLPFAVFTYSLEVIVALIQAFVFTLLSCVFITMLSSSHSD